MGGRGDERERNDRRYERPSDVVTRSRDAKRNLYALSKRCGAGARRYLERSGGWQQRCSPRPAPRGPQSVCSVWRASGPPVFASRDAACTGATNSRRSRLQPTFSSSPHRETREGPPLQPTHRPDWRPSGCQLSLYCRCRESPRTSTTGASLTLPSAHPRCRGALSCLMPLLRFRVLPSSSRRSALWCIRPSPLPKTPYLVRGTAQESGRAVVARL